MESKRGMLLWVEVTDWNTDIVFIFLQKTSTIHSIKWLMSKCKIHTNEGTEKERGGKGICLRNRCNVARLTPVWHCTSVCYVDDLVQPNKKRLSLHDSCKEGCQNHYYSSTFILVYLCSLLFLLVFHCRAISLCPVPVFRQPPSVKQPPNTLIQKKYWFLAFWMSPTTTVFVGNHQVSNFLFVPFSRREQGGHCGVRFGNGSSISWLSCKCEIFENLHAVPQISRDFGMGSKSDGFKIGQDMIFFAWFSLGFGSNVAPGYLRVFLVHAFVCFSIFDSTPEN